MIWVYVTVGVLCWVALMLVVLGLAEAAAQGDRANRENLRSIDRLEELAELEELWRR